MAKSNKESKLVYLYIHDYQSIKKQGFLFTSEYIATEKITDKKILFAIDENPNHLPSFFSKNITEVSAIVGVNGSGKSSILKFISNNLSGLEFFGNYLAIIKTQGKLEAETSIKHTSISIEHNGKPLKPKSSVRKDQVEFDDLFLAPACKSSVLDPFEIIKYYNGLNYNILNSKHSIRIKSDNENNKKNRTKNISTNFLSNAGISGTANVNLRFDRLDAFYYEELKRNLELIESNRNVHRRLPIPEVLAIRHNAQYSGFSSIRVYSDHALLHELDEYIEERLKAPLDNFNMEANDLFLALVRRSILVELLKSSKEADKILSDFYGNDEKRKVHNAKSLTDQLYEPLFEHLRLRGPSKIQSDLQTLEPLLENLRTLTVKAQPTQHPLKQEVFVSTASSDFSLVLEIIRGLRSLKAEFRRIIGFEWRTLSSGEQAFLNFLSRLNSCKSTIAESNKTNILILIDEGDLNFHPEWQRTFLNDALEYTTELFPNKKLQFIFTSNTPFIVADLPKDKVIHLNKEEVETFDLDGNKVRQFRTVVDKAERSETFASNIHTLLASNFYLSSFLGEFAKEEDRRCHQ